MVNQLSEAQASLIECLKFLGVTRRTITAIMLLIPEDHQIAEMADFLMRNKNAEESQMLEMAVQISEE